MACPFLAEFTSTIFLALSQAPPALAMKIAWYKPKIAIEIKYPMKKYSSETGKCQRDEEHRQEDIEHALLGVLRANLDDALAVFDRCARGAVLSKSNVGLDEFHGPISPGHDGLRRRAGEPINHRAAGDQAQQERRMQHRQVIVGRLVGQVRR